MYEKHPYAIRQRFTHTFHSHRDGARHHGSRYRLQGSSCSHRQHTSTSLHDASAVMHREDSERFRMADPHWLIHTGCSALARSTACVLFRLIAFCLHVKAPRIGRLRTVPCENNSIPVFLLLSDAELFADANATKPATLAAGFVFCNGECRYFMLWIAASTSAECAGMSFTCQNFTTLPSGEIRKVSRCASGPIFVCINGTP